MSDDKRKPPRPPEDEWERALDAWETIEENPEPEKPAPAEKPERARTATRGMPVARGPLYHPPADSMPTPVPPAMDDAALASLQAYDDEDDDERTIVGRISPELLAHAGDPHAGGTGSGLGQVFRRNAQRGAPRAETAPAATSASRASEADALMDSLFENPATAGAAEEEPFVVTSAPRMQPNESGIPEDERKRSLDRVADEVAEGELFDPFAPSDNSATVRPAALHEILDAHPSFNEPLAADRTPQHPADTPSPPSEPPRASEGSAPPPPTSELTAELERPAPLTLAPGAGTSEAPAADSSDAPSADDDRPRSEPAAIALPPSSDLEDHGTPASPREPADLSHGRPPAPRKTFEDQTVAVRMRREGPSREAGPSGADLPDRSRTPLDTMPDERAVSLLDLPEAREAWCARAEWLEEETRAEDDRHARARGLLIASELFALVDEPSRTHELSTEARELAPNHPLAHRQARALAMREGDWTSVTQALQGESRTAPTAAAKAHDAMLSAEVARLSLGDEELSTKRLEQATRADPTDARPYLNRMAGALARGESLPRLRFPDAAELQPIADAFAGLQRWHGSASEKEQGGNNAVDLLLCARAALRRRDAPATVRALDALGDHIEMPGAAGWLSAAVAMAEPALAKEVSGRLVALADGAHGRLAHRALVSRAIAMAEPERALAILSMAADAFAPAEHLVVQLLCGASGDGLQLLLQRLANDPENQGLAHALQSTVDGSHAETKLAAGADGPALASHVARRLAAGAPPSELVALIDALKERGLTAFAEVLASELSLEMGQFETLATSLASPLREAPEERSDRALVAALLFELSGAVDRARELYITAEGARPGCEAALRAALALSPASLHGRMLLEHHQNIEDPRASALVLIEAAHIALAQGDGDAHGELLQRAHERAPSLPLASWLSERRVRAQGSFDDIVWWLRERRNTSHDPIERAFDMVREALLVADRDLDSARELLQRASDARPRDLALRDLYERLSATSLPDKAPFWAERALEAAGESRARLALLAAYEYEIAGDAEQAARLAQVSIAAVDTPLARLCRDRNEARSNFAANLADRLLREARTTEDGVARVEAYEQLAELDELSRGDVGSAVLWHRSILEERPSYVPSLSRLFHWLTAEGRDDELEPLAAELGRALHGAQATAHAYLAARLRTRAGPWAGGRDHVRIAFAEPAPPLWAVRDTEAHAVLAHDAGGELAAVELLLARTTRPHERTTLALRGADAAERSGDSARALAFLREACQTSPTHLVAARALAELADRLGQQAVAAGQWETVARLAQVPAHRLDANYRAATAWLDGGNDVGRARAALESAASVDITHRDVFARLQAIYVAAEDRPALASLLEARLATEQDPEERIELEIARGRTLAEIGEGPEAKRALALALEARPDHPDALRIYADICSAEADWGGAEQALIRLARLVPEPAAQAAIYARLGELYAEHQPNLERAELAFREVLKRQPNDTAARERLIALFRQGNRAGEAIELAQELVRLAPNAETKRQRTIELALLFEHTGQDRKRGEALLEAARKESPHDVQLLSALAEMYTRGERGSAVQGLLDRAAGDARRALSTGRFEVTLFATMATVARLRGRTQAARIADATVAAMEGRPGALVGADGRAVDPSLDDQIAPDLLGPAFRTLLRESGHLLDAVVPVDLSALRAAPLARGASVFGELRELAESMGLADVELFVAPTLGGVCVPASSRPPRVVLGAPLLTSDSPAAVRRFLVTRALKIVQVRASALARSAPVDLMPLVSAYLLLFAPSWQPGAVDSTKLADMHARLLAAGPIPPDSRAAELALEVIASLGNRTSTLHTVVNGWGNRVALLSCGDMSTAFGAIARAAGHAAGPAPRGPERITWIGRNAEARDLALFGVSDAYAEVRTRLDLTD